MTFRCTLLVLGLASFLLTSCLKPDEVALDGETANHPLQEFEEKTDSPIAAARDRYQRRLSENGKIPDGAFIAACEQRDALLAGQTARFGADGVWPIEWQWIGPGNIGGRLRPIVIHPTTPDIMYVGSASGGVWKTTNGGATWFVLDDFMSSLSIGDLVMHPEDPDTLYAGTGEGFFETEEGSSNTAAVRGAGIFVSVDAGVTWNQMPSTDNPDFYFVNRIAFDPLDSGTLFAATNTGIWRSDDAGQTWSLRRAMHALDIKFNPNDPDWVVAGGHEHGGEGPAWSNDGGLTWNASTGAGGLRHEIAWAESTPNTVYAAVSTSAGYIRIWRSTNGGQSFTQQTTTNTIATYAGYNNTIWVDPVNASHVIVGGVYLYRSLDAGVTWTRRFNSVHADMHRIVAHPSFNGTTNKMVYFACDGGIYRTNDVYQSSATALNNNLGVTQFYGCGINPANGKVIGGTQDNGTLFYSGNPQGWVSVFGGDGGYGASDPTDPNYFYGEVQYAYLHRGTTGGTGSNSYIYAGPNPIQDAGSATTTNFIPFFTLDPNNPNRMLVCCRRLWRSNNVKATQPNWFSIKDSIAPPAFSSGGKPPEEAHFAGNSPYHLSTVAIARGNSDVIWAAHNNGSLFRSTNGTDTTPTWTRVDENGSGLPDRWISTVVIDPNNHSHVYVAFMGWDDDNLWETTDNGNTWTDITGAGVLALPDAPLSALAINRHMPGWIFAGTDIGIFMSGDNGATWSTSADSMGKIPVEQLLWKDDQTLMAVTHGRGVFLAIEQTVFPSQYKLLDADQISGTLADVYTSNDQYLRLDPSPTTNPAKQKVAMLVQGSTTSLDPGILQFRLQANMNGGPSGDVKQRVYLINATSGAYEEMDVRPASVEDSAVLVNVTGDRRRFINQLNGEVTAVVVWDMTAFSGSPFDWNIDIDEAVWLIK